MRPTNMHDILNYVNSITLGQRLPRSRGTSVCFINTRAIILSLGLSSSSVIVISLSAWIFPFRTNSNAKEPLLLKRHHVLIITIPSNAFIFRTFFGIETELNFLTIRSIHGKVGKFPCILSLKENYSISCRR